MFTFKVNILELFSIFDIFLLPFSGLCVGNELAHTKCCHSKRAVGCDGKVCLDAVCVSMLVIMF